MEKKSAFIVCSIFFFNDTATTEIYTLSLHDALPILVTPSSSRTGSPFTTTAPPLDRLREERPRSEEHTSELQSHSDLVCRLLLEKKKTKEKQRTHKKKKIKKNKR